MDLPRNAISFQLGHSPFFEQLETGKLSLEEFCPLFKEECKISLNVDINVESLFTRIHQESYLRHELVEAIQHLRQELVEAIQHLRQQGVKEIAVTNNWKAKKDDLRGIGMSDLDHLVDDIIESCIEGYRKPSLEIFKIALSRIGNQVLYLDDLQPNLDAAASLGIHCIRVGRDLKPVLGKL
jgi:epoxide hydrolase-like predicted phosphatase